MSHFDRLAPLGEMMRVCLLLAVSFAVVGSSVGCGGNAEPSRPNAAVAVAKRGRHADLVGRWTPTLPPLEARRIAMGRALLADPPSDAAFEAIHPTDAERATYKDMLKLRAPDYTGPHLARLRQKLAEFEAILVGITPTTIDWATGGRRVVPYRVLAEDGNDLTIAMEDRQLDVRFLDKDHLSMRSATETFLFTRDEAIGLDAAVPVAAWNGTTARPGRDGTVRDSTLRDGTVRDSTVRDACMAYADCIEQMPRRSGDGDVMLGSASVIRGWGNDPELLRRCAEAHAMARAATLCR